MKHQVFVSMLIGLLLIGCTEQDSAKYHRGIYLLLDTSGTYTKELHQAKQVINIILADLEPGDAFAVARVDSGSFSEKDIIAKLVVDGRPSIATRQKQQFAETIQQFTETVESSSYTDISGGLLQATEFLNEANTGSKSILIYSDLKEELPKNYTRNFSLNLNGFEVKALNVTKLRSDNRNPQEYLDRLHKWSSMVESSGGHWTVINDLDKPDAINLSL